MGTAKTSPAKQELKAIAQTILQVPEMCSLLRMRVWEASQRGYRGSQTYLVLCYILLFFLGSN